MKVPIVNIVDARRGTFTLPVPNDTARSSIAIILL